MYKCVYKCLFHLKSLGNPKCGNVVVNYCVISDHHIIVFSKHAHITICDWLLFPSWGNLTRIPFLLLSFTNHLVEKRKLQHELNVPGKDSKRQRKAVLVETTARRPSETCVLSTEAVQVHSRLSRTQRLKRLRQGAGLCDTPQPTPKSETEAISYGPNTGTNCGLSIYFNRCK